MQLPLAASRSCMNWCTDLDGHGEHKGTVNVLAQCLTMGILCLLSAMRMHEMVIKGANAHCPCKTKHILLYKKKRWGRQRVSIRIITIFIIIDKENDAKNFWMWLWRVATHYIFKINMSMECYQFYLSVVVVSEWRNTHTVHSIRQPLVINLWSDSHDVECRLQLPFWLRLKCVFVRRLLMFCSHLCSLSAFFLSLTKSLEFSRFCLFPVLVLFWVDDKHKSFFFRVECKNVAKTAVRRNENPWQSICFNRF